MNALIQPQLSTEIFHASSEWHRGLCNLHGLDHITTGEPLEAILGWLNHSKRGDKALYLSHRCLWLNGLENPCDYLARPSFMGAFTPVDAMQFSTDVLSIRNCSSAVQFFESLMSVRRMRAFDAFSQGYGIGLEEQFDLTAIRLRLRPLMDTVDIRFHSTDARADTVIQVFTAPSNPCIARRMTKVLDRLRG